MTTMIGLMTIGIFNVIRRYAVAIFIHHNDTDYIGSARNSKSLIHLKRPSWPTFSSQDTRYIIFQIDRIDSIRSSIFAMNNKKAIKLSAVKTQKVIVIGSNEQLFCFSFFLIYI